MAAQQGLQFTFRVVAQSEIELAVVRFDWQEALANPFCCSWIWPVGRGI